MYLAIEGVIGVGKTSLARLLQPVFDSELLLEVFEENPFLSDFYADRKRHAFQTQIYFLLSRYRQQLQVVPAALESNLIADYTFAKDALFAGLNLEGDEMDTYRLVHTALAERIPTPDLIVYLQVSTDIVMRRISMRDRTYERNMDRDYIDQLNLAYESFFIDHRELSVLTVDTDELDFVSNAAHLERVENRIRQNLRIPPFQQHLPIQGEPPR